MSQSAYKPLYIPSLYNPFLEIPRLLPSRAAIDSDSHSSLTHIKSNGYIELAAVHPLLILPLKSLPLLAVAGIDATVICDGTLRHIFSSRTYFKAFLRSQKLKYIPLISALLKQTQSQLPMKVKTKRLKTPVSELDILQRLCKSLIELTCGPLLGLFIVYNT